MNDDYKKEFIQKYHQLDKDYKELMNLLEKFDKGTLGYVPTCPIGVLMQQARCMSKLKEVLERRAECEQIGL